MAESEWTLMRMLKWTTAYLTDKGDEHPRLSAEWLISNATGLSRVEIYTNYDRPLDEDELKKMHDGVLKRGRGEPLQYVTGEMPFRHIILRCERGVLIPRPETEILVDVALTGVDAAQKTGLVFDDVAKRQRIRHHEKAKAKQVNLMKLAHEAHEAHVDTTELDAQIERIETDVETEAVAPAAPRVLEIGTGTGCIAASIASERPGVHVVTTDISSQALSLARRNCAALHLEDAVDVVESDLAGSVDPDVMGTFAVLVSNPPYIPTKVLKTLPEEVVGYEPALALDGGPDGLDIFRKIIPEALRALAPGGMLCCELFEDSLETAAQELRDTSAFDKIEIIQDLTHRPRIIKAIKR